jgi:formyl-CoA transferase
MALPLSGVRVVEIGQVLAGPFASAILSDLGADVVKIERPEVGDDARMMGPAFRAGDAINFHVFNRGKRSAVLNLKARDGRDALRTMLFHTDIFIHNLRPGTMKELGLDGEALCREFPELIYCDITAFGSRGPRQLKPSYEGLIQAYSGLSSMNGGPDDPPMRMGASVCDLGTGMWAVIGALAALQRRQTTGRGGVVNASLLETALVWAGQRIDAINNEGREPERHRSGTASLVPYQAFDTSDGSIVICAGNNRLFDKLANVLGHPEWALDENFKDNRSRIINKDLLLPQISRIIATESRAYWSDRLEAAEIPCSPINSLAEVLREPQVQAINILQPVVGEDYTLIGLPLSFDGERPPIRRRAPCLGEHTDDIINRTLASDSDLAS